MRNLILNALVSQCPPYVQHLLNVKQVPASPTDNVLGWETTRNDANGKARKIEYALATHGGETVFHTTPWGK